MDESELSRCIRHLLRQASQDDDPLQEDASETTSHGDDDDSLAESNKEYQALVQEVEAKLIEFLEGQVTLLDDESAYTTTSSSTAEEQEANLSKLPIHNAHAYPCNDSFKELPASPEKWPQRPVMIRPTPGSTTKIRGIRYASERDYKHFSGFCAGCILVRSGGMEEMDKSDRVM